MMATKSGGGGGTEQEDDDQIKCETVSEEEGKNERLRTPQVTCTHVHRHWCPIHEIYICRNYMYLYFIR